MINSVAELERVAWYLTSQTIFSSIFINYSAVNIWLQINSYSFLQKGAPDSLPLNADWIRPLESKE